MKKKIQTLCWVLFTIFSAGCLFINFISEPPVDNVKALTGYMICAAAVSVLYPGAMLFLGLRNRWLYEQLQRKAEVEREALESLSPTKLCLRICLCWSAPWTLIRSLQRKRRISWSNTLKRNDVNCFGFNCMYVNCRKHSCIALFSIISDPEGFL